MSDYEDIMDLLGPSVTPFEPSSREVSRPAPPTVRDTTSEADVWLPTSVAAHYKEYDRFGPAVDELEALIARDGLLTPIRISTDGEVAVVHEGNHRLQVAERLGIPEVPAIVTFDSRVVSNGGRVTPLEPVLSAWVEQNRGRLRSFWGHRIASDYFMDHRPAGPDYGGPMHDVSDFFPDIENLPTRIYDFGEPGSQGSIRQIIDAQGNPSKSVTIYRTVPKGADPIIRNGDWVTISREYAEQHGRSNADGNYDVLSATVQAKDIWTEGNSVNEWGYHGPELRTARTYTASVEDGSEYLRTPGAKIDWTPAEAPFDGIWFGFNGRDQTFASYYHAGIYDEEYYLLNKAWSDERIAKLQWTPSGEVAIIWTKMDYRRIGLATALFNWTKANIFPGLQHSDDMTPSGYEWAKSMGHDPEDWELMRALPHYAASAGKLYRGVRIDLGVDLSLAQPGTSIETVGQELQLGPQVLDALSRQGGLGTHWSTRPEIAERFALESSGNGGGTPALITVDWNGSGEDLERTGTGGTWTDEAEVTLLPGTPITVTSIKLGSSFRDGVEVLHSDRYLGYASDFAAAGLPVPQGGPQQRTAEWQPWQGDDSPESDPLPAGTTIYRGMKVDFSDSDFDQIWRWQQPPLVEEERGQHFKIGPFILDRLEPLGIHWTTKKRIAEIGASQGGYGGAGVIIEAEYTGTGQDLKGTAYHNDGWSVEEEITMLPGAQVRITGVFLTGIEKNKNLLRGPELRSAHRTAGTLRLYHGTTADNAEKIKVEGLRPPAGIMMPAQWFMLTDSFEQAARYAPPNNPVVLEFVVPETAVYSRGNSEAVLWASEPHDVYGYSANAYAVKGTLPPSYLTDIRTVTSGRTASSDIIARGFKFDEVGFELAQKYMNGTMTGRDILQEIETKWGSVGIWWGSIGPTGDDFYGSASDAQDYAGWAGDGSIEHRWEDMLRMTGGEVDPSEWMDAEIRVVLVAKKPMRDYGIWNPTTENGEGSMWESTSYFEHGERLELVEIQYAADYDGDIWKSEAVGGLTVTAQQRLGYSISELPNVGPTPDRYWGEGGCGYFAIAFQQLVPELKIAVEWDRRDRTVNHAWVYGGGKLFDYMGTQTGGPEDGAPYFSGSEVELDVAPQEIASSMRFSWSPSAPWENDMVFEASQVIERHWGLYVPEDDFDTYASRTAETIQYQRNNNGMRGIEGFGQDIEPWGKYMILDAPRELPAGWERGEVTFNNPLRIDYADGGWKQELVDRYGTTGKDLSQALLSDGYDGIITEDKYGVAEIVDIRTAQRTAGTRTDPGGVYRGINVQVLSHDEQEEVAAWANGNSFSMDNYQLAEPNYELVYRILDRLDSGGLGRHWSKDYDVSADFARDQGDGIELILIGHWEGEGVDQREFHRGWDGVQRPSNLPHEEEVTLYPGTPVTLVGMDIVTETGFTYNIPVPNIQVTAGRDMKHLANRTAASDLRVHLYDSEGREMWLEPDFDGNPWTYHRKVMDAVRFLADVAQSSGVYWHMDHNEFIPSTITDFKVFDGPNDVTHEIKEFPQLRGHYASRTAASTPSAPGILYRGIGLPLSEAQWEDVAEYQGTPSFANKILSYMTQGFFGIGSGSHWTTEFEVAKSFSQGGTGIPVVLVVDWDGQGEDVNDRVINNFGGEAEVTLLPGTKVKIVDLLYGPSLESIIPNGHGLKGWSIEASRTAAVDYLLQKLLDECETSETSYHDHAILQSFMTFPEEVLDTHPFAWELKKCQKEARESEYPETDNVLVEWLIEINEKGKGHQSRTAAEPGGVLPWNPSHRGYTWITKTDGTLEAVTNDGVNRMYLHEYPYGWEWEVFDSLGFVEGGTFGMALKGGDALRDRANDLLAEFDTRAERRTRGPSWGYQDDYTQAPNTLWSKREAWSNSPWADYDFENPTYAPYGPMTLYRGFSFEANPGVADQLLERLKAGEPVVKVFEDALIESRYSAMQFGDKVGVYWSTDKDYALNLAMVDSFLDDHVGLYIQAHWEGGDHDINFGTSDRKNYWGNESEVRLLPGTEVKGLEVGIHVGGRWHTSGTGQSFTAERTSPLSARKTTSERYAERLRREGRR